MDNPEIEDFSKNLLLVQLILIPYPLNLSNKENSKEYIVQFLNGEGWEVGWNENRGLK